VPLWDREDRSSLADSQLLNSLSRTGHFVSCFLAIMMIVTSLHFRPQSPRDSCSLSESRRGSPYPKFFFSASNVEISDQCPELSTHRIWIGASCASSFLPTPRLQRSWRCWTCETSRASHLVCGQWPLWTVSSGVTRVQSNPRQRDGASRMRIAIFLRASLSLVPVYSTRTEERGTSVGSSSRK
jgi:hypothetical protein